MLVSILTFVYGSASDVQHCTVFRHQAKMRLAPFNADVTSLKAKQRSTDGLLLACDPAVAQPGCMTGRAVFNSLKKTRKKKAQLSADVSVSSFVRA